MHKLVKKANSDYLSATANPTSSAEVVTRLFRNKQNKFEKSRVAANESVKANRKAKTNYYNSVNGTLRNPKLTAKKKFAILLKLTKKNKHSSIPPISEKDEIIVDEKEKTNIFNKFFF